MVLIKNKIKKRQKATKDEFGYIVPKVFKFETLATYEKKKQKEIEKIKDCNKIISVIKYKPQHITYKKFKCTQKQLELCSYLKKGNGFIRELEDGSRFHVILVGEFGYIHRDLKGKKTHIAVLKGVQDEINRILKYKDKNIIIEPPKEVEIVYSVKDSRDKRVRKRVRTKILSFL